MLRFIPLFLLAGIALEIASIIWVGGAIGVLPTLLLLILAAAIGGSLIRSAGLSVVKTLRSPVQTHRLQEGLASATLARFASGLLFIVPGFCSDALALLLLLPAVRNRLGSWIRARVPAYEPGNRPQPRYDTVIEAEAIEIHGEVEQDDRGERPR